MIQKKDNKNINTPRHRRKKSKLNNQPKSTQETSRTEKKHQETLEKFLQKSYTTSQGQGKKEKCRNMPKFEEKPNGYYVEVKSATMRLLRQWTKRLWTTSLVD